MIVLERMVKIDYHSLAWQVSEPFRKRLFRLRVVNGRMGFSGSVHPPSFYM